MKSTSFALSWSLFVDCVLSNLVLFSEIQSTTADFVKAVGKKYGGKKLSEDAQKSSSEAEGKAEASAAADGKQGKGGGFGVLEAEGHYAECYPGGMEEYDATYDSDEDVDFSKMDMVSHWYLLKTGVLAGIQTQVFRTLI